MIYFDHAAAMPVLPEVKDNYPDLLEKYSGNPEAAHRLGHELNKELAALGDRLFDTLLPQAKIERKACFFGCDTAELLNVVSYTFGDKNLCCAASALEHISLQTILKRSFGSVVHLPLNEYGKITGLPAEIASARFIAVTHVQSEIGVMQDLPQLLKTLRSTAPQAVILLDMVQSGMFYDFPSNAVLPDLIVISGAKMGSGSGAALLAINSAAKQLKDKFHELRKKEYLIGKTDIVQAAALTLAVQINAVRKAGNLEKIRSVNSFLRGKLEGMLLPNGQQCRLTVPTESAAANILHFTLPGYQAGVLVRMFSAGNIMLSSGSACQSESDQPSMILQALKYSRIDSYSGIRLSFSGSSTIAEAEEFLQKLTEILKNY